MVREIKVNGASGGPGSGKEGACRPAGCLLGGEARLAVPLAWPRRQPDFCRERNRRWSCPASRWCCCRRLHSRQKPGRASPARRGEQPTSAQTRALHSTPAPDPPPNAKSCIGNTLRPRTTSAVPRRGKSPQTNHPTPTPRGNLTPSARTDPRRTISPEAPRTNLAAQFHLEHPT